MIQVVIIDDEISNAENLSVMLAKHCPEINVAGIAQSVEDGIKLVNEINPSVLFLDIQMPGRNGFDLLKTLPAQNFEVIFVTAYDKYAIQAIKFSAIDYLLKPVNSGELIIAVEKAIANIKREKQNLKLENLIRLLENKSDLRIAISSGKETVFILTKEIIYCRSDNNYTLLFLRNKEKHVSSKPIFEFEEILTSQGFIRCHQSYLVNKSYIKKWIKTDGDRLLMEDGSEIPVARNRKEKIKSEMMR